MRSKLFRRIVLSLVVICLIAVLWILSRPGMSEVGIPYAKPAPSGSALTVTWLGVATLLIDDGKTQIMTDGFVSRPALFDLLFQRPIEADKGAIAEVIDAHEIDRLAAIMPVHSHYDHAMDTADFARLTGADVLGSASTANIARSSFLDESRIKTIKQGEAYSYGLFRITFYESRHAPLATNSGIDGVVAAPFELPAPYTAWQEGESYAIHIDHPQGSILIVGSAGFVPGALEGVEADVVFLGTGGLMGLTSSYLSEYVAETVYAAQAKKVVIIHHDDLFGKFGSVEQSKIIPSFDRILALDLQQLVLPAQLMQPSFGVPIAINGVPAAAP
jgi:L-ascorbate metabolism protein UlaG (beta-lactamase superfamily)